MKNHFLIATGLFLTLCGGKTAKAGIVFDSITGSTATGFQPIIAPMGPLGDTFTNVTASTLTDVKVGLYNPSATATGTVTVALYSINGASLGSNLATLGTVAPRPSRLGRMGSRISPVSAPSTWPRARGISSS